jgi:Ca-activated chloride channel family protein
MSNRARRLGWGLIIVVVAAGLLYAYQRFILSAPDAAFSWVRDGVTYELLEPRTIGILLVVPVLMFALGRSLADLPWPQRVLSLLLRAAFLALLALALARLVRTAETQKVCTVFLVDVSDSVPPEALADARSLVTRSLEAREDQDLVKLITFARRPRLVPLADDDGKLQVPPAAELRHADDSQQPPAAGPAGAESVQPAQGRQGRGATPAASKASAGTDLQAALQLAYAVFPPGYLKRAVLVTDGVETEGDVLAEANRARGFGVKLFAVPYRRPPPGEVAVRDVQVPDRVKIGEAFEVIADIYSSRDNQARARLYQGEALNGLDGVRELALRPGQNEVKFRSVVHVGGAVTYSLQLDRPKVDKFAENNRYSVTLDVPGRPSVLYVEGQPQRSTYLRSALSAQQFDVDVREAVAFPRSLSELERYDFVIVSDVPKEQLGISAQALIEKYVRDLGGGFLFAGGEAGYGLGGWAHTTLERILPVRMDAERRKEMPSVAMVLVIDRSGSMTGLPIEMAKAACKATVSTLQGDDLIEVVAFDSEPTRYVKMQPARYRSRIQNEILRIQSGGGTEIFSALDMAYQDISVVQARKKHVILLTDGRAPTRGIKDLVQAMIAESITVTTVGLGSGADADLLRMIADTGGGRYHHVPDPNSLPKIFTRETEMVARQAAVQEWFPVQQVAPADFLQGIAIGSAPLLHGYVATQMKGPPAQLILASDRGEPILAKWRVGLGQTLAWTSDVKNLWAVDWLRWSGWSKFWGQLVRDHMRKKHRRELDMHTEVVGNRVRAVVDAFTVDERFDNDMQSTLAVTGPAPGGERREYVMRQTAPGRYEAEFFLDRYGSFLLQAEHRKVAKNDEVKPVGVSFGHICNPYPREYASFEPDIERLKRAALAGGGSIDPDPKELFAPGDEKIIYHEQLWNRFLLAAILCFLLDLLVRRVRLFDRKFLPKKGRGGPQWLRRAGLWRHPGPLSQPPRPLSWRPRPSYRPPGPRSGPSSRPSSPPFSRRTAAR